MIVVTNLSLLVGQTQAYREIHRQIHVPKRVSLAAGTFDYALSGVLRVLRSVGDMVRGGPPDQLHGRPTCMTLSAGGRPYPWQAAIPVAPFTTANLATGNTLVEVPVVDWQPLGRPVAFSFFHSTYGEISIAPSTMNDRWRHSYMRSVSINGSGNGYKLHTDEDCFIVFDRELALPVMAYAPPDGFHMTLYVGMTQVRVVYKNQDCDIFDRTSGRLIAVEDASGNRHEMSYMLIAEKQCLTLITDASTTTLELQYDDDGMLEAIVAPSVGRADSLIAREYEIDQTSTPDLLRISTARRDPVEPTEPLFWASFVMTGCHIDEITDRLGTTTELTYGDQGRLESVTRDPGGLDLTTSFEYEDGTASSPLACPMDMPPVVFKTTVTGVRLPNADVTEYRFDRTGRLTRVTDPLGRDVANFTWDDDYNPLTTMNVHRGVTTRTFDNDGNVLTLQPPVGGMWQYSYLDDSSLASITDPLGNETHFDYTDAANPTRPTLIDGPGVSNMTLEWGSDDAGNGADRGKLLRTVSPNLIEQTTRYWDPPSTGGPPFPAPASPCRPRTAVARMAMVPIRAPCPTTRANLTQPAMSSTARRRPSLRTTGSSIVVSTLSPTRPTSLNAAASPSPMS